MSMKFAGFMGAVREDRLAREKREEEEKVRREDYNFRREMQDNEFDRRAEIASLDMFKDQRKKDAAINAEVSSFLSAYNLPSAAAPYVRQEIILRGGIGNATKAYDEGLFSINVPEGATPGNSGSAKLSGDAATVRDEFMTTVRDGGLTNPYGLAAVMATATHESGFKPANVNRTWSDPSETGRPGTAGGIMSWNNDRLKNMQDFTGGDSSPAAQARFFLSEDPELVAKLNNATSVEEAQTLMDNAWRFAGYNRAGGEAAARLATATSLVPEIETLFMLKDAGAAVTPVVPNKTDDLTATETTTTADTSTTTEAPTTAFGVTRRTAAEIREEKEARERLQDGQDAFTRAVTSADTVDKLLALGGALNTVTSLDPVEKENRKQVVQNQIEVMQERERQKALAAQEPLFFYPTTEDGQLTSSYIEIRRTSKGTYVDPEGNAVDVTKGRYFADNGETSWKIANTQLKELNDLTTGATSAAMALVAYRNAVVAGGDAGVNRYLKALSKAESEMKQLQVLMAEASKDGSFAVRDGEFRDRLKNIAMTSSITDMTLLNAAYSIAAMRGSSGQALSDKELTQNLNALGAGKGSVQTILGLIDSTFNDTLLPEIQAKRTTKLDGIGLTPSGKAFVDATNLNDPFRDVLDQAIRQSGNQRVIDGYQALIDRDTSYDTGSPPPTQTPAAPTEDEQTPSVDLTSIPERTSTEAMIAYNEGQPIVITEEILADYPSLANTYSVGDVLQMENKSSQMETK